jgi:hypothetical protein
MSQQDMSARRELCVCSTCEVRASLNPVQVVRVADTAMAVAVGIMHVVDYMRRDPDLEHVC